jgi:Reverse transcriptase (RNA-dependent DNA polymerase)
VTGTLAKVYDRENIERAWRWPRSNSDGSYKGYFRNAYSRYALADSALLDDLQDRLQRGIYEPAKACKLYWPKRSGILRSYSLLTVEDQIVYQAFVNVVAEQLFLKVQNRYLTEIFGHLYAGKTSIWFYRKWSDGYRKFNEAARDAVNRGLKYTASFDLTACYDSLDHRVLRHFLQEIGCDQELCERLTSLLSVWTATDHQIFHGHGIPQGPLGSGLLSEVVLQHFDQHYGAKAQLRYLRYVDDIRLFAGSEPELRKMIVRLDMLSKDVGLFPQSGKIEIHEVKNIEAELKSISNPVNESVKRALVDQHRLRIRIAELSPRFEIADETRFKYLLAHAQPHSSLSKRLIRILSRRPDLIGNIASYFARYTRFPASLGEWFLGEISRDHLYAAVHARIISTAEGRLRDVQHKKGDTAIKKLWTPNARPELLSSLGSWSLTRGLLTDKQVGYALRKLKSSWVQSRLIECLSIEYYGRSKITAILNENLRSKFSDVALAAAVQIIELNCPIENPLSTINRQAGLLLRELGYLRRAPSGECGIRISMTYLLGKSVAEIDWKQIFGQDHRKAELQAVWCRAYALTNATSFVNAMDVFNDWLLIQLYAHNPSLGTYVPGKIGSILNSTRLDTAYPKLMAMVRDIHDHRYGSHLSHAKVKNSGKPTGYIRFSYLRKAKRLMVSGFLELAKNW